MTRKGGLIWGITMSIVMTVAIIFTIIRLNNSDKIQMQRSFSGVIQKITIGEKNVPTVIINGISFDLDLFDPDLYDIIHVNDSLVKRINHLHYLLYRKDSSGVWQLIYYYKRK